MRKSIQGIIAFVLVLQLIIPYPVYAAAVGKFTSVIGTVTQTRDDKALKPVLNSPVEAKDQIATGDKSSAKMVFDDKSTITLASNSKMVVKEFAFMGTERRGIFSLTLGKLIADVTKFVGGKNAFEVHTPTSVCGVRGTGFEVVVAESGLSTTVTCTSGSLTITAFNAAGFAVGTTTLVAGQSAVITASGITVGAAGAAGAAGAGAAGSAAGGGVLAGVGAGTVAAGAAIAAGVAAIAITASGGGSDVAPAHHAVSPQGPGY